MARDAATSESATDWLRHTGHFSVAAMASTCSSVVRGGPSSKVARAERHEHERGHHEPAGRGGARAHGAVGSS